MKALNTLSSHSERLTPLEVGAIPPEWNVHFLEDVCSSICNGFVGKSLPHQVSRGEGVTYVQGFNVRPNRIDLDKCTDVTAEFAKKHKKARLHAGDLLTVQSGHIGTVAVVPESLDGASCHALIISRPDPRQVYPDFVAYYLNSEKGQRRLLGLHVGSTIKHINTSELAKFKVPLPPVPEQKGIAAILSTCDEAIEKTGDLIKAKQRQKKALMQQLLTGKKRLPGFEGNGGRTEYRFFDLPSDWACPHVREIAQERSERNGDSDSHTVLACSKHFGFVESATYFKKQVFSEDTSNYKVVRRGWLGFPSNHVEEGSIGLLSTHDSGIVSPIYCVFETSPNIDPEYLYAVFKTETFRHIFSVTTNASVDRRGSLRWDAFSAIPVPCPSVEEQQAIAEVNRTATEEIRVLEDKLAALKQGKKSLMQKLLTGQVRVKV